MVKIEALLRPGLGRALCLKACVIPKAGPSELLSALDPDSAVAKQHASVFRIPT